MRKQQRFVAIEGPVSYIIGFHDTTDVSVTQHTTHRADPAVPISHPGDTIHRTGLTRAETHTFVNTSREFAMLFEVNGHTYAWPIGPTVGPPSLLQPGYIQARYKFRKCAAPKIPVGDLCQISLP